MRNLKIWYFLSMFVLLYSCKDTEPLSPMNFVDTEETLSKGNKTISVMTRNIYVGTDVDMIIQEENPELIPVRVAEAFMLLQQTNFPERALALAEEIADKKPDLIGLQEVSKIRIQSPGDAAFDGTVPAEEVLLDYLDILMSSIGSMGLNYEVAAIVKNADVEMPMLVSLDPMAFDDVRLTDYDVILAKKGVKITDVEAANYETKVVIENKGIELPRGYVAVTAKINGVEYRFVNTHLEDADQDVILTQIQMAQAEELAERLDEVTLPIILVGDFNSAAPDEPTYQLLTEVNAFSDAWRLNNNMENILGYTYGHDLDLSNTAQNFWKRIDYILVKKGMQKNKMVCLNGVFAEVVGDELEDKTSSGLWPSDHGGIFADLAFRFVNYHKCKKEK